MTNGRYLEIGERPWGQYFVLEDEPTFKVKRILVNPGQRLSLQSHQHRYENWLTVEGVATVEIQPTGEGLHKFEMAIGEKCFIPQGAKHRLSNETDEPVTIIEVQLGTYFGEDDIVRYEDDYARG
jgi:mannose-6-phosphate isomerase